MDMLVGAGAAAGSAAQADAHTKPEQPAVLVPVPEVQLSTAEMIELLEAELEAEYCCPLTLVCCCLVSLCVGHASSLSAISILWTW